MRELKIYCLNEFLTAFLSALETTGFVWLKLQNYKTKMLYTIFAM